MEKKIEEMTDIELKAIWLDQLADIERCQNNINAIKKEFERRKNQLKTTPEKAQQAGKR